MVETNLQHRRIGAIIKAIGSNPGITLTQLRQELSNSGIGLSEKTLTKEIDHLKHFYELLAPEPRLRNGYVLQGFHTIGTSELPTVIDALWAFGFNLNDPVAWRVSRRLGSSRRTIALRQRNIYKSAVSAQEIGDRLELAIKEQLAVRIVLETPRAPKPLIYEVYPLFKVFYEKGWFLITCSTHRKAYYATRVDRIKKCEILKQTQSTQSHDKDIENAQMLMNSGWGMDFPHTFEEYSEIDSQPEVVVRFDSSVAAFIREGPDRHPKARMAYASDGTGHLDFRIKLKYYSEFRTWVRSWGSKAWFLEPQAFIDEEIADVRRQMMNYKIDSN